MKKNSVKNILIGADIEVFLKDKQSGEIVSAEGFIKGTKESPFNYDPSNKYFQLSLDNVEAEFGIPPVTDKKRFLEYIKKSLDYINSTVPPHLCTSATPAAILDDRWLQTDQAKLFGCEPDYCVWTKSVNIKPEGVNPNLRSAGGHIHIGYENPEIEVTEELIKSMDLHVGIPSVLQEPDNERKNLYGKAGAFRFKDYGAEYRTVSNYYLASDALMSWVFDSTLDAINRVNNGFDFSDALGDDIQDAINNNNKKLAKKLVDKFQLQLA